MIRRPPRSTLFPLHDALPISRPGAWLAPEHPLGRRLRRAGMSAVERHLDVMSHFPPRELASILSPELARATRGHDPWCAARALHARAAKGLGELAALPALDALTYMTDDVLVKVDRTSMMNSLETRAPLLDHHVLEWGARMPFAYKLRGGVSKWALRECVRPLLPPAILARGKQGFGVPLERWFAGERQAGFRGSARALVRGRLRPARARGAARPALPRTRLARTRSRAAPARRQRPARRAARQARLHARLPRALGANLARSPARIPRDAHGRAVPAPPGGRAERGGVSA